MRITESRIRRIIREVLESSVKARSQWGVDYMYIRDDSGELIRVPKDEALKYFQREAQKSHQRADELEAQTMAFRKEHDQKMSAGDAAFAAEMKKSFERRDAYNRILRRMMKEILKYQSAGNHAGIQALGNLQQKIYQAVMDKNDVKLHEFEKAIMSWN